MSAGILEKGQCRTRPMGVDDIYHSMCHDGSPDIRRVTTTVARLVDKLNNTAIPDTRYPGKTRNVLSAQNVRRICSF